MAGENGNGNGNGNGAARVKEIAQSQITWFVTIVAVVATTASGFGIWISTIQTNQARQQEVLEKVIQFMDDQTRARRASGSRERQRKEFCTQGVLTGERCLFLPSEPELQAMER